MESSGAKGGGWRRSFPASVFSEGGGRATRGGGGRARGRGGRGGVGGGGQQHQHQHQQQQSILLRDAAIDSLSASSASVAAGEEDLPGEDISLLDNRPVDQKMLRKRNQGHTQKMNLDDPNVPPSQLSLTAKRFEASNDRHLHLPKSRTEEDEEEEEEEEDDDDVTDHHQHSSLSSSSSSSSSFNSFLFKPKPKPDVRENRIDEIESESESETADASFQLPSRCDDAMTSPYDVRVVSTKRDVIAIVDETLTCDVISGVGRDRTRRSDVTAMRAKEPELGNLIDFD